MKFRLIEEKERKLLDLDEALGLKESLGRYADTDAQEEAINRVEKIAKKLGINLRFGTKVGKYPQTVILDYKYQDGAVSVSANGNYYDINGITMGDYRDASENSPTYYEIKDALKTLLDEENTNECLKEDYNSKYDFEDLFWWIYGSEDPLKLRVKFDKTIQLIEDKYGDIIWADAEADADLGSLSAEAKEEILDSARKEALSWRNIDIYNMGARYVDSLTLYKGLKELLGVDCNKLTESLKEGVSKNMSAEDIAKKHKVPISKIKAQLAKGIKVEKEHTKDEKKAERIALDHLFEIPNYYDKLDKMEKDALKEGRAKVYFTITLKDDEGNEYEEQEDLPEDIYLEIRRNNNWPTLTSYFQEYYDDEVIDVERTGFLKEDTIKQDGKWVNKGKEGTHGKFATKKAADAQRKAMFANGFREDLDEKLDESSYKELKSIKIPGYKDTWSEIDRAIVDFGFHKSDYRLMENDEYGDETCYLLITPDFKNIYETFDNIEDCLRDEFPGEELSIEYPDELDEKLNKSLKENYGYEKTFTMDEIKSILNIFKKNSGDPSDPSNKVIDYSKDYEYDEDGNRIETFVVEADNSNPTYLTWLWEDLAKLESQGIYFDYEGNGNGFYGKTYIFYHYDEPEKEYENLKENEEPKTCVICKKEYTGYGNNAEPVAHGRCCDKCNKTVVIPTRLKELKINESLEDLEPEYDYDPEETKLMLVVAEAHQAMDAEGHEGYYWNIIRKAQNRLEEIAREKKRNFGESLNESRPRTRKEIVVLQGNYGYGWDDLIEYELTGDVDEDAEIYKEIRQDKRVYAENEPQYSHRTIHRFEKIEKVEEALHGKDEITDFFDKAKRLGVKTLADLKRLLNEPESIGNTEKEKIDAYANAVELGDDTLSNESLKEDFDEGGNVTSRIGEKLIQGKSDATLKKNIATEIKAGKDPKQAYAIAKSIQKKNESFEDEHLGEVVKDDEIVDYFDNSVHNEDIVEDDFDESHIEELAKRAIEEFKKSRKSIVNENNITEQVVSINESLNGGEPVIDYTNPNMSDSPTQPHAVDLDKI